ncbi:MAG: putative Ig domain-containing protein, partial [Terriglobales bacterium]
MLAIAVATTSCGTVAQAAGLPNNEQSRLNLYANLPGASVDKPYNAVLAVSGGNSPYQFALKTGSLPPGISLNPTTGTLAGKPTNPGTYSFSVLVTDLPHFDEGTQTLTMMVAGGGSIAGAGTVRVTVSPAGTTLFSGETQQFTATVSGTSDTAVTWSATAGSINATGLYVAPAVTSETTAVITATSQADSTKSASSTVTINPPKQQTLEITTGNLAQGQQGDAYSEVFTASGGASPYSWNISSGTPPPGVSMNPIGDLSGTPTTNGNFSFTVTVTDANKKTANGNFSINVVTSTGYDGPAQLPIATFGGTMADTPAPGSVITVNAGGNLQSALNNAVCGDTIQLQAGATFTGVFQFPAKSCDSAHWIIVRTSAPDSSLPAEGQRITPCYAGVASLPGRPKYACNNPQNVLAKLVLSGGGDGPVSFQSGANHYRLLGLELTRPTGASGAPALITVPQGTASYIVVDRSWLHGTIEDDTRDGVELSGTNDVAVVDSYFTDFHCTSETGACTDSHAVSGGLGNHQDGPYEIRDNFLEASGEAVMFGGGAATLTPTDITVHFNHFFKPWQWMPGNSPFQGGTSGKPFVVKNHMELKNAVRVLAEANLMENVWGGFSQ